MLAFLDVTWGSLFEHSFRVKQSLVWSQVISEVNLRLSVPGGSSPITWLQVCKTNCKAKRWTRNHFFSDTLTPPPRRWSESLSE